MRLRAGTLVRAGARFERGGTFVAEIMTDNAQALVY
jgi:hypothetical protein